MLALKIGENRAICTNPLSFIPHYVRTDIIEQYIQMYCLISL
jgi:hypothetical protein